MQPILHRKSPCMDGRMTRAPVPMAQARPRDHCCRPVKNSLRGPAQADDPTTIRSRSSSVSLACTSYYLFAAGRAQTKDEHTAAQVCMDGVCLLNGPNRRRHPSRANGRRCVNAAPETQKDIVTRSRARRLPGQNRKSCTAYCTGRLHVCVRSSQRGSRPGRHTTPPHPRLSLALRQSHPIRYHAYNRRDAQGRGLRHATPCSGGRTLLRPLISRACVRGAHRRCRLHAASPVAPPSCR